MPRSTNAELIKENIIQMKKKHLITRRNALIEGAASVGGYF